MRRHLGLAASLAAALAIVALWVAQGSGARLVAATAVKQPVPAAREQPTKTAAPAVAAVPGRTTAASGTDPNAEDDPQEPEVVLPGATAVEDTRFVWGLASNRMQQLVADTERFPELWQCRADGNDCTALEAEAIRKSLKFPVAPEFTQGKLGVRPLLAKYAGAKVLEAAYATASTVLTDPTHDAGARVVALALLERAIPEAGGAALRPLPEAAYDRLLERPPVEAELLLRIYEEAPTRRGETADAIRALALDPSRSPEMRGEAIRALGHTQTSGQLRTVVIELLRNGGISQALAQGAVAPALARCADACADALAQLGRSRRSEDQMAALIAVAMTKDPATQSKLLEDVLSSAARKREPGPPRARPTRVPDVAKEIE